MVKTLNHSPNSPFTYCPNFKFFVPIDLTKFSEFMRPQTGTVAQEPNLEFNDIIFEQPSSFHIDQSIEKEESSSNESSEDTQNKHEHSSSTISHKLDSGCKRRKNKEETKQQIQEKHKDQGRGGNCIASNITKTLIRVIQYRLQKNVNSTFKNITELYKIKSQKENTIIIFLILYDMVKKSQITLSTFDDIFRFFMMSLKESKNNCEKKMIDEPQRKGFHQKNRKMYVNFIKINTEVYDKLRQSINDQSAGKLDLKSISDIISDTYDRKQRQIQKAISKIKSIILNYPSLKALFELEGYDIEESLFEAVDYAYRRNLEKRCKQSKAKVHKLFEEIERNHNIKSEEDKFFMCYLAVKLIGEKQEEIWEEFVKSSNLKRQYNQTKQEIERLTALLKIEIPLIVSKFETNNSQNSSETNEDKMEDETSSQMRMKSLFSTYAELKNNMEF